MSVPFAFTLAALLGACQVLPSEGLTPFSSPQAQATRTARAEEPGSGSTLAPVATARIGMDDMPRRTPEQPVATPALPITQVTYRCSQATPSGVGNAVLEGRVLGLDHIPGKPLFQFHILDHGADRVAPVPFQISDGGALTSPGYSHLAYLSYPGLAVLDAAFQPVTTLGLQFGESFSWLDDYHLATYFADSSPVRMKVWDIATGALTRSSFDFPRYWIPYGNAWVYGRWGVVFSRDLQRAVYTYGDPVAEGASLWSLPERKSLWAIERWSSSTIMPTWDPTGESIAIAALDSPHPLELFIVSRAGVSQQWVNVDLEPSAQMGLLGVSWSPDGRYIAFAIVGSHPLYVLDTKARSLLQYCVRADASQSDPIWSPNGTHLIVRTEGEGSLAVDLADGTTNPVFEDPALIPVAWLP